MRQVVVASSNRYITIAKEQRSTIASNLAKSLKLRGAEVMYKQVRDELTVNYDPIMEVYYFYTTSQIEGDVTSLICKQGDISIPILTDIQSLGNRVSFLCNQDVTTFKAIVTYLRMEREAPLTPSQEAINTLNAPLVGLRTDTQLTNNELQRPFDEVQKKVEALAQIVLSK